MKLLILGGTLFLGRHIVETALARGHDITIFNRGQRNPDLFPTVKRLVGDRNSDMSALIGQSFDAVGDRVAHYTFVSTISTYAHCPANRMYNEDADLDPGTEGYGAQKARAEETMEAAYPNRVAQVRPGLIVGPHDPTGRFTYWPRRFAAAASGTLSASVLAPGLPSQWIQWIDVRDLAQFCVHCAEQHITGRYNAVTPAKGHTFGELLDACNDITQAHANVIWKGESTLLAENVAEWTDLPLWIAQSNQTHAGMMLADSTRAMNAGLAFTPLIETVQATLDWCAGHPDADAATRVKTITPEREAEVLAGAKRATPQNPL
jgi:2'-hydroxyisoflavone reductase